MAAGERHSRCPWDGLKANDELVAQTHRAVQSLQTAPRQGFVWIAWVIRPLNGQA